MDRTFSIPSFYFTTDGGERLLLRDIRPGDKHFFRRGWEKLSPQSVFYRFHTHNFKLTEGHLNYFTHVDQFNHVAIGVINPDDPSGTGIGVGRFVRTGEQPDEAEIALTVIDEYQKQHIGTTMLAALSHLARKSGISTFRMYIHRERKHIFKHLSELGGVVTENQGNAVRFTLPVDTHLNETAASDFVERYAGTLRKLERL